MSVRNKSNEEKKYNKDLRNLEWLDTDYHFYKWIDVEVKHKCSPNHNYYKVFKSIWTGKAENYSDRMNMKEWEENRIFYKKLCGYSRYF